MDGQDTSLLSEQEKLHLKKENPKLEQIKVAPDNFNHVNFIRQEVRFQHDLLNNRVSWYVASQSFLVTAFAVSASSIKPFSEVCILPYIAVPSLGVLLSIFIIPAINAAIQRIDLQNKLLARFDLQEYLPPRDSVQHNKSLQFASAVPVIFMIFWVLVLSTGAFKIHKLFTEKLDSSHQTARQITPQPLATTPKPNSIKGK